MLQPAQLYSNELQRKMIETWYKPEYMFANGAPGDFLPTLDDNNATEHDFVSFDNYGNMIGYVGYTINWITRNAGDFKIVSFDIGNLEFVKDVYSVIYNCFTVSNLNRVWWKCYADNPALRGYRSFIKRCGGVECGRFRQNMMLSDGKLHDEIIFEILRDEFRPLKI